jgi:enamine deaminase RidA (YjgF/YER057c/UK114 family)
MKKGKEMRAEIDIYNPVELGPPMGQYTHVTRVKASEFLFIAGMLSGDSTGRIIGEGDFDVQTTQVFSNIEAALKSAEATWSNIVQFTTYLVSRQPSRNMRQPVVLARPTIKLCIPWSNWNARGGGA